MSNNKRILTSSPESTTEKLLFNYLRPHIEKTHQQQQQYTLIEPRQEQQVFLTARWDDTFLSADEKEASNIMVELNNFSDLIALKDIEETYQTSTQRARTHQKRRHHRWSTTEEELINLSSTNFTVPASVRHNIESSQMLDVLMNRAVQHWCCIGFKVAPVSVDLIRDWRSGVAPHAIVYCIAAISLVTFMDQKNTPSHYSKQAAMVFYEQARNKMDDILFDDMQPLIIQSYFCLSYTSNLLRLYEQQRTWGGLASISLQHLAKNYHHQQLQQQQQEQQQRTLQQCLPEQHTLEQSTSQQRTSDQHQQQQVQYHNQRQEHQEQIVSCWFRWYYIDAWLCLTLNRDCLLPDSAPWMDIKKIEQLSIATLKTDQHHLYSFANLTHYMRRYIRALHSGKLFINGHQKLPSPFYYEITNELTNWYKQLCKYTTVAELHLHLCYNSIRLIVLYQFLNPQQAPPDNVIIDCLQTNLELLQGLQQLKDIGCDQSTYHHMFFAIHNTARRIFQYNKKQFTPYAHEQLLINLMLLKSTQAYAHDVFKMKIYAEKIQDQFNRMNISSNSNKMVSGDTFLFRKNHNHHHAIISKNELLLQRQLVPTVIVFKQENIAIVKRSKKN